MGKGGRTGYNMLLNISVAFLCFIPETKAHRTSRVHLQQQLSAVAIFVLSFRILNSYSWQMQCYQPFFLRYRSKGGGNNHKPGRLVSHCRMASAITAANSSSDSSSSKPTTQLFLVVAGSLISRFDSTLSTSNLFAMKPLDFVVACH